MSNLYRGTSLDQDGRFCNRDKKLINLKQWPKELEKKIDISRIELSIIKKWAEQKTQEILGFEDDIMVNYLISGLQECKQGKSADAKQLYLNLAGFLGSSTQQFMLDLWKLLDEAQHNQNHLPMSFIHEKQQKIIQEQQLKLQEEIKKLEQVEKYMKLIEDSGELDRFKKKEMKEDGGSNHLMNVVKNNQQHNKYFVDKKHSRKRSRSRNNRKYSNSRESKSRQSNDSFSVSSKSDSKQSSNFEDDQDRRSEL